MVLRPKASWSSPPKTFYWGPILYRSCSPCEIIFSTLPTHGFPWIGVLFSLRSPRPKFNTTVFSLGRLFSESSFIVETKSNYDLATIVNVIMLAMTENCDLSKLSVSCVCLMCHFKLERFLVNHQQSLLSSWIILDIFPWKVWWAGKHKLDVTYLTIPLLLSSMDRHGCTQTARGHGQVDFKSFKQE